jgi:hypothetical protein
MRIFTFLALIALGAVSTAGSGGIVVPNGSYLLKSSTGDPAGSGNFVAPKMTLNPGTSGAQEWGHIPDGSPNGGGQYHPGGNSGSQRTACFHSTGGTISYTYKFDDVPVGSGTLSP